MKKKIDTKKIEESVICRSRQALSSKYLVAAIGVDHSILHAGGMYGAMTEMNAAVQAEHPNKATGSIWVDEPSAGKPAALSQACHNGHNGGEPT